MDCTLFPADSMQIEQALAAAKDILHQDPQNILLLLMPQPHAQTTDAAILKHTRLLEDKLMGAGVNIGTKMAVHYFVNEEHGSDRRRLMQEARLCYSDKLGTSWSKSASFRGRLGPVQLIRVKDMLGYSPDEAFTPQKRVSQRGVLACAEIVKGMLSGMDFAAQSWLMIVDLLPGRWAEFGRAALSMQAELNAPMIAYLGLTCDEGEHTSMQGDLSGILMEQWWDHQPEAGPKTRPKTSSNLQPPNLRITRWDNGSLVLPENLEAKFPEGSAALQEMKDIREKHLLRFPKPTTPAVAVIATPRLDAGPDYSVKPPRDLKDVLELESRPLEELENLPEGAV